MLWMSKELQSRRETQPSPLLGLGAPNTTSQTHCCSWDSWSCFVISIPDSSNWLWGDGLPPLSQQGLSEIRGKLLQISWIGSSLNLFSVGLGSSSNARSEKNIFFFYSLESASFFATSPSSVQWSLGLELVKMKKCYFQRYFLVCSIVSRVQLEVWRFWNERCCTKWGNQAMGVCLNRCSCPFVELFVRDFGYLQ